MAQRGDNRALRDEMRWLMSSAPIGARADLARRLGITTNRVASWRAAVRPPGPDLWPGIEEYVGLPAGHLAAVDNGTIDPGTVTPTWPLAPKPPAPGWVDQVRRQASHHRDWATPGRVIDELDRLTALVEELQQRVEALERPGNSAR